MTPTSVMVLSTFHFEVSDFDLLNPGVNNILGERRQIEIHDVIASLAHFNPTKIAVEALPTSTTMTERLAAFRLNAYSVKANEVDQIGLRLAYQLDQHTIYGVDYRNDFPFEDVQTWAESHGQGAYFSQIMNELAQTVTSHMGEEQMERMTIRESLYLMNLAETDDFGHSFYMRLLHIGDSMEYPGADLVTRWYERNLKIMTNILRIAAPGDRILVIIGFGHGKLLKQFLRESPDIALIQATHYLKVTPP